MIAVELGLISKLIAQSEASGAADFGPRQFTNHQISFAHAKIERAMAVGTCRSKNGLQIRYLTLIYVGLS